MADLLPRLPRVEALIGRRLGEIDAATVERMVITRVREDTDLDFKLEVYKDTDKAHQDAAADVAAMANGPGGAIFLGIRDHDGAAAEVVPVAFSETTELRLRQAIISLTAPAPLFVMQRIPVTSEGEVDRGIYMVVVPPSPYAPHAVRLGSRLGYPRRSGPHTRWLSESEVADAYRARFISGEQRGARLEAVRSAGEAMLDLNRIWLATALVPVVAGDFTVRRRSMLELQDLSRRWFQPGYASHLFIDGPQAEADVARVVLAAGRTAESRKSRSGHAELYTDGSAFAATPIGDTVALPASSVVDDEWLVEAAIATSAFAFEFAERAGATGDAYVSTTIIGREGLEFELVHARQGFRTPFAGTHRVSSRHVSRRLVSLEDATTAQGRLVIARMLLTEVFQWFGYPEVPQITEAGMLRRQYFGHQTRRPVEVWAAANSVEFVETTVDIEP